MHSQALTLFYVFLALAVFLSLLKGGAPERLGALIIILLFALEFGARAFGPSRLYSVDPVAVVIDGLGIVSFGALALHARRAWPIWATALQILSLTSHFAQGVDPAVHPGIYIVMKSGPTFLGVRCSVFRDDSSPMATAARGKRSCLDGLVGPGDLLLPLKQEFVGRIAEHLGALEQEALLLVYLTRAGAFLGDELIDGGTSCSFGIPYRLLFERAFRRGATRLVLAHNHPSGSARPSELDIKATRGLQALAVPMEVDLVDHLIVGAREVFSMRAAGLIISRKSSGDW